MADDPPVARGSSYADLYGIISRCQVEQRAQADRIEDKIDQHLNALDNKVDALASRLDHMEGALGMLKWLGPTGIAALVYTIASAQGFV